MTSNCPTCAAPIEGAPGLCPACARSESTLALGSVAPEMAPASVPGTPPAAGAARVSPAPPSRSAVAGAPSPHRASEDSRRDERFAVPTDVLLRKLSPSGEAEKEERTIAHDLSRSGMRLLTSWSDLETGDRVALQEVGGGFSSQGVVRHLKLGTDRITRVGVEFVGTAAPDRLVGTTTSLARPVFDTARSSSGETRPASAPVKPAIKPPPIWRPEKSPPIARPVVQTASVSRPGGPDQPRSTPAAAPRPLEEVREEIDTLCGSAREMAGESRIWEALDCLAKAQALAEGTPAERAIKILTLETQARIPSMMRAAQQTLQDMARSEPEDVAVHSALGRIFLRAGLSARARGAFSQVLTLDPLNREATAALAALSRAAKQP